MYFMNFLFDLQDILKEYVFFILLMSKTPRSTLTLLGTIYNSIQHGGYGRSQHLGVRIFLPHGVVVRGTHYLKQGGILEIYSRPF
jgi:hypothetical protein